MSRLYRLNLLALKTFNINLKPPELNWSMKFHSRSCSTVASTSARVPDPTIDNKNLTHNPRKHTEKSFPNPNSTLEAGPDLRHFLNSASENSRTPDQNTAENVPYIDEAKQKYWGDGKKGESVFSDVRRSPRDLLV